jgi:Na+/proline symporter
MVGLTWIDWAVILVYLIGITILGVWAARRVDNAADFFISDRHSGYIPMIFFSFGTGTHSDQAVGVAAKAYTAGASGIWYQWLWLFVTPFYWLIAPLFRRTRAVTTSDYFDVRFGKHVGALYAVVGMIQMMVTIGVMLRGAGAMVDAVSGGQISMELSIWAMTAMFLIYGLAGGLNAAILTDFIQGILTVILSFLILPFALQAVGGLGGLREMVDNPDFFTVVAPGEITTFYVFIIALNGLVGWVTQPHSLATSSAGPTEMEGRVGVTGGNMLKRVCTIAWVLTGMVAVGLYAGQDVHIDYVYGLMAGDLLPAIAPGLVGLFIASLLAAVMGSCDSFMVASSALFTQNVYRRFWVTDKSEEHYIWVGRAAGFTIVLLGLYFAFEYTSVVEGLEVFWAAQAMMGIVFWAGLFWRKATAAGAWAGTLAGFAVWLFTSNLSLLGYEIWSFSETIVPHLPAFMVWEGAIYLPWQMIAYLTAGLIATVVVSLYTRPMPEEQLDRFYRVIRTPVGPDEPQVEPFTLPEGVEPPPRDPLIDHPDFEIEKPSKMAVVGFIVAWIVALAILYSFIWIIS